MQALDCTTMDYYNLHFGVFPGASFLTGSKSTEYQLDDHFSSVMLVEKISFTMN